MQPMPVTRMETNLPQAQKTRPASAGAPICCKRQMQKLVRRAILRSDGTVRFCAVWSCSCCGMLLL